MHNITEDIFRLADDALCFCKQIHEKPVVIAVPVPVTDVCARGLLEKSQVAGIILHGVDAGSALAGHSNIGSFDANHYTWNLPKSSSRTVLFLGQRNLIGIRMVQSAARQGVRHLVYGCPGLWRKEHIAFHLCSRFVERILWICNRTRQRCVNMICDRCSFLQRPELQNYTNPAGEDLQDVSKNKAELKIISPHFSKLLNRRNRNGFLLFVNTWRKAPLRGNEFVAKKILLVNNALAWGGAERQVVNTLHGLIAHGVEDVSLLCEMLHASDDHKFFVPQMQGIRVDELNKTPSPSEAGISDEDARRLRTSLEHLPVEIAEDVMRYATYFFIHRPSIVHIWQDITSIKAGLAAIVVGVPRIILAGRNVAPTHFAYYQHYMRDAFCALLKLKHVYQLNNSDAGAMDYARWLGVRRNSIRVIHNGMAKQFIERIPASEVMAYRKKLGIPVDALLIGAVFRFYEEKDPLLWVRSAAIIAGKNPTAWFLIVGTGPMRDEIHGLATEFGFADRLVLPGTDVCPANALSSMDVFLLTSRFEGTPNVLIEAQWLGVPVVTTDAGGVTDTIKDGVTGWVVRKRDPHLLAEKVLSILDDATWHEKAKQSAPELVHKRFALERMIQDTMTCYGIDQ